MSTPSPVPQPITKESVMTLSPAPVPPTQRRTPALPTPAEVVLLQAVRDYPCVSLLMGTTPGPAPTAEQAARLELVLDRGGWVALVDDGALTAHEGVALTLRS